MLQPVAMDGVVAGCALDAAVGERPVHSLDDVAAIAQVAHRRFQLLGYGPDAGLDFSGETEALERLQIGRA
jgi:hypothetical protein